MPCRTWERLSPSFPRAHRAAGVLYPKSVKWEGLFAVRATAGHSIPHASEMPSALGAIVKDVWSGFSRTPCLLLTPVEPAAVMVILSAVGKRVRLTADRRGHRVVGRVKARDERDRHNLALGALGRRVPGPGRGFLSARERPPPRLLPGNRCPAVDRDLVSGAIFAVHSRKGVDLGRAMPRMLALMTLESRPLGARSQGGRGGAPKRPVVRPLAGMASGPGIGNENNS